MIYNELEIRKYYHEKWFTENLSKEFLEIIKETLSSMEDGTEEELDRLIALGSIISYEEERWVLLRYYCWSKEANWEYTINCFKEDIKDLVEILS